MPDGVRFDIKMIDIKIESNIPNPKNFHLLVICSISKKKIYDLTNIR